MLEVISAIIGLILIIIAILVFFLMFMPWSFGAPFQPSSRRETENVIKLANVKKGDVVADLGSGNGTLVIKLAKKGAEVHGYEINPILVWWARKRIKKLGLKKAYIHKKSFWKVNLGRYNVITVFQIYYIMNKLGKKLDKEVKKGTRVVSNTWKFPKRKFIRKLSHVYLYKF